MVNMGLIRPYFWGRYVRGGWLVSHNDKYKPWFLSIPNQDAAYAGVSSFGFGGTNAHAEVDPTTRCVLGRCYSGSVLGSVGRSGDLEDHPT